MRKTTIAAILSFFAAIIVNVGIKIYADSPSAYRYSVDEFLFIYNNAINLSNLLLIVSVACVGISAYRRLYEKETTRIEVGRDWNQSAGGNIISDNSGDISIYDSKSSHIINKGTIITDINILLEPISTLNDNNSQRASKHLKDAREELQKKSPDQERAFGFIARALGIINNVGSLAGVAQSSYNKLYSIIWGDSGVLPQKNTQKM